MRILLAGGGTAGHINPALAIARFCETKDKNTEALFIGKTGGMESRLVPKEGFDIEYIDVEGFSRKLSLDNILTVIKMCKSYQKSLKIIDKFKPDVVVGTGGYVCVPPVLAAIKRGIPTLIHEQNVFAGSAIKMLSSKATVTAISFKEGKKYLSNAKNIVYTGNPVRPSITTTNYAEARKKLGIKSEKFAVIFGGSLGAKKINDVVGELCVKLNSTNIRICWATGDREYQRVLDDIKEKGIVLDSNIELVPYIHNMETVMNAADVVISRSGAITLSELCVLGKPSILVPSPNVTNNHQEYNARALADNKAAIMILEKDFNVNTLYNSLMSILSDKTLADEMSHNAKKMGSDNATELIYKELLKIV